MVEGGDVLGGCRWMGSEGAFWILYGRVRRGVGLLERMSIYERRLWMLMMVVVRSVGVMSRGPELPMVWRCFAHLVRRCHGEGRVGCFVNSWMMMLVFYW